eukprot:TRINITY_DN14256_c0_g1_i2.p1 TRINITY_DN14256_c0_g1~~TRINITY_DN14256_c0_g1_i2.p1  ORF type:complete len:157 (+),score=11.10 TRINITY_DN14256_c0_g1_i2:197-667(+)
MGNIQNQSPNKLTELYQQKSQIDQYDFFDTFIQPSNNSMSNQKQIPVATNNVQPTLLYSQQISHSPQLQQYQQPLQYSPMQQGMSSLIPQMTQTQFVQQPQYQQPQYSQSQYFQQIPLQQASSLQQPQQQQQFQGQQISNQKQQNTVFTPFDDFAF